MTTPGQYLEHCRKMIAEVDYTPPVYETGLPNPMECEHVFSTAVGPEICTKCNTLKSELQTLGQPLTSTTGFGHGPYDHDSSGGEVVE